MAITAEQARALIEQARAQVPEKYKDHPAVKQRRLAMERKEDAFLRSLERKGS